ncbi:efflux RND transporter periplasmic adaptor subunit [Rugosibacter aromaticivorans]|uniref:efflux RND transporter periplasmic adaptor subunit n=1 Tax=Rugosibacter aromaticivorans TaxID=1565605 RepID=UPI000ADF3D9F|nr:efflux RND transporter periplasmic adaptor subunit [Rugosibacter aromaticivorans]
MNPHTLKKTKFQWRLTPALSVLSAAAVTKTALVLAAIITLLALGVIVGRWWAEHPATDTYKVANPQAERRVLYWYDPMAPQQKFDKPGKSPFMDMELVPKYADDGDDVAAVKIDLAAIQNLGMRLAVVTRARLDTSVQATGIVGFNEREVTIVQARVGGFVEYVAKLAPNDVIGSGALIAEVLVPEWAAVQQDYLALKNLGDDALIAAARERMRLAGMPESLIREVASSGQVRSRIPITAPGGGVVLELGVRPGMTLTAGQTLARINGIGTVWLEVGVPQAQAGEVRVGQSAEARFAALPGETIKGRVTALLPSLNDASRTLRVRVELPNTNGRLRPGLTAQVNIKGNTGNDAKSVLRVPTEAVIRTGRRALVIVAEDQGHYRPVEVTPGREIDNDTVILSGLSEGQKVVASGQFLIDSEASLQGITASMEKTSGGAAAAPMAPIAPIALHETDATIEAISATEATLAHGPLQTLAMPAMTMTYALARPELSRGLKAGDRVHIGVRETDTGLVVEKLEKTGGGK